ncbi:hypothetical protein ACFLIM_27565 [Nonomuraea sp. M3C6]|uniref:Tetracyclin repressor-like C-terminal domain-containing protein n=1 Tax=Nonomuraea marmarensis TaxID=3351344 RepID=A0ABW7AL27_9ACTN
MARGSTLLPARPLPGVVVIAANALAATLWQVAHPADGLVAAYRRDPSLSIVGVDDFTATLTRLLAATCAGLARR